MRLSDLPVRIPDILLPDPSCDLKKWSVIACDQHTSDPTYWDALRAEIGPAPSTLDLIFPEAFLGRGDDEARIRRINGAMRRYRRDILTKREHGFVYVERTFASGTVRHGLMLCIDLDAYDFDPARRALIRATEATVPDRLPPRVAIRRDASLELPHVLLLCDDKRRSVIAPLASQTDRFRPLYDTDLLAGGGHLRGWLVDEAATVGITDALADLVCSLDPEDRMLFAVGDGNHSLAAAKKCRDLLAASMTPEEAAAHPSRWALCELVDLHDESLVFAPIHRVVFHADTERLLSCIKKAPAASGKRIEIPVLTAEGTQTVSLFCDPDDDPGAAATALLQSALDAYLATDGKARIDYVHGDDTLRRLASQPGSVGFLLPAMEKAHFFDAIRRRGCLARKTFSMGQADEKRYYMECRAIR